MEISRSSHSLSTQSAQFGRKATPEEFMRIARHAKETWGLDADPAATFVMSPKGFFSGVRTRLEEFVDRFRYIRACRKDPSLRQKYHLILFTDFKKGASSLAQKLKLLTQQQFEKKTAENTLKGLETVTDFKIEQFGEFDPKVLLGRLEYTVKK